MLRELEPVWTQLEETYEALDAAMSEVADDGLYWAPGPGVPTVGEIAQHIARANITYGHMMVSGDRGERFEVQKGLAREAVMDRVRMSQERAHDSFEMLPLDRLHAPCADEWEPFGVPVPGPLDALWFAQLMVRHTSYHLGQIVYIGLLREGVRDEA